TAQCQTGSTTIEVKVYPDVDGGQIANNQTICYNSDVPAFTNVASPSGGNGTYTYQWQQRTLPSGSWTNIANANQLTYNHGNLQGDTEFRRVTSSCGQTDASNVLMINVRDPLS